MMLTIPVHETSIFREKHLASRQKSEYKRNQKSLRLKFNLLLSKFMRTMKTTVYVVCDGSRLI